MTECTNCRRRYDNGVRFCPVDGYAVVAVAEPLVGRVVMGQYAVQSVAGHGATGTVYRALQTGTDREVALKILRADLLKDPDAVKRFVREARAGARLSHTNIATVHSIGQTEEGAPFIVMEYVEGAPLSAILRVGKPLPLRRITHIGEQIASALSEAHTQGVVHRDLKPENILLTERRGEADVVKVVDFGIAKMLVHVAPGEDPISRMGTVFGTPHYIAPEQAAGQPVDGRADIYSLGCILFQMATGRVPFDGQQGLQVLLRQVRDPVPDPRTINPRLSDGLCELILSMLAKDPADRPQTVLEVAQSLAELGSSDEPVPASGRPRTSGATAAVTARSGGPRRARPAEPGAPSARSEESGGVAPPDALDAWSENAPSLEPFWKRNAMVLVAIGGAIAVGAVVGLVVARMREPSVPVPTTTPVVSPAPLPGSTPTSLIRSASAPRTPSAPPRPATPAKPPEPAPAPPPGVAAKGLAPTVQTPPAPPSTAPAPAPAPVPNAAPAPVVTAPPPAAPPAATPAPAATAPTAPPAPSVAPSPAPASSPEPAATAKEPAAPKESAPPPATKDVAAKDPASTAPPAAAPKDKEPDEPGSDPYQQLNK